MAGLPGRAGSVLLPDILYIDSFLCTLRPAFVILCITYTWDSCSLPQSPILNLNTCPSLYKPQTPLMDEGFPGQQLIKVVVPGPLTPSHCPFASCQRPKVRGREWIKPRCWGNRMCHRRSHNNSKWPLPHGLTSRLGTYRCTLWLWEVEYKCWGLFSTAKCGWYAYVVANSPKTRTPIKLKRMVEILCLFQKLDGNGSVDTVCKKRSLIYTLW
jgi:hypothetical protein